VIAQATAWLEGTALAIWTRESPSIWAYPTILTLHTVGLGIVVGSAFILDFRLLGVGAGIPTGEMRRIFPLFWFGFFINLVSGVMLFVSEAADKGTQPVFLIKLGLVAAGVVVTSRLRHVAFDADVPPVRARTLAKLSMMIWAGAIVAGRLMAYLK